MMRNIFKMTYLLFLLLAVASLNAWSQQPKDTEAAKADSSKTANSATTVTTTPAKPAAATGTDTKAETPKAETISPAMRLSHARTAYIKRLSGSDIPYTVIVDGLQGWGHFVLVTDPEKADIVLEVESPEDTSGLSINSNTKASSLSGEPEPPNTSWGITKQSGSSDVKLSVRDTKSHNILWRAVEPTKTSIRKTSRENSLVEAGQHLFVKFHDRIEPPLQMK
jgi:hypothetical protein